MKTGSAAPRLAAALVALLFLLRPSGLRATEFFDGVPRKGYVRDDLSLDVLDAGQASKVVARVRYVRLALDPGRRDIAWDYWPEREMLLIESAGGDRLVFERVTKLPDDGAGTRRPLGRIGLDGVALETFGGPTGNAGPCAALDLLIRAGNVEVPVASSDLDVRTVRLGIAKAVESAFGPRERDLVTQMVPILVAAQSQGVPAAPLQLLGVLFPGQPFARTARALTFRISAGAPLDPGSGGWRSVTDAPDMLPGTPVF